MSDKKSILDVVDTDLGALNYAVAMQKNAASVGFDWPDVSGVIAKIHEELDEVIEETKIDDNHARLHDEIGDLLFACTNLARHLNIDPEQALQQGNQKFFLRFSQLEQVIAEQDLKIEDCSLEQLDAVWEQVKNIHR